MADAKQSSDGGGEGPDGSGELFLIDGNSLAYRAFFALPESMATSDGRPTNAIYGLASMMVKLLTDFKPRAVVVAWDAGWSGREKTYAPYKAQRKSRPDLLKEQWPHLMPLAEAFGFANVRVEGYEADDVIATMTRQAREREIPVMVLTGDRDAYQLVGDGVRVMSTGRGVTDTKVYDREGVIERYGVPPELVTDLIGLKGDTSDNIPGVPGIGDKTAAQLLQEFGDLETVLASVDKISGKKRKENLTEHADDARVSKQLATMHFDVDTGIDLSEVMEGKPDRSRLHDFAAEFEMRQVIQRLEEDWDEAVPERSVDTRLEVESEPGTPSDLADAEVAIAYLGGRWAGWDGERLISGEIPDPLELASRARLAADRRPRRQVARRGRAARADGRGAAGVAAAQPRHDGRRLPDRPRPAHLRARRARRRRGDLGRGRRGDRGRRRAADARRGGGGTRPRRAGAARGRAGGEAAPEDRGARPPAPARRGRDAADRGAGGDGGPGPEAGQGAARGDLRLPRRPGRAACRRRSGSSPATSSRSARPSSSARSSSPSSA